MKWWGWALAGTVTAVLGREAWHEFALHGRRAMLYQEATKRAVGLGRPLLVVGAPTQGLVAALFGPPHGCGSVLLDATPCDGCETQLVGPVVEALSRLPDDRFVVFVSHGLEDVVDLPTFAHHLDRVSGGHLFVAHRHHATLAALLFDRNRVRVAPPEAGMVRYTAPSTQGTLRGVVALPRTSTVRRQALRAPQRADIVSTPPDDYIDVPVEE